MSEGRKRVVIEGAFPQVDCGVYPVKRIRGEELTVRADIFCDGHDEVSALLLYRREMEEHWREEPMKHLGNDRWEGSFVLGHTGVWRYTIIAWVDHFKSWQKDLLKKYEDGQDVSVELDLIGTQLLKASETAAKAGDRKAADRLHAAADELSSRHSQEQRVALGLISEGHLYGKIMDRPLATRYQQELAVIVEREKAGFSAWYEIFPRSLGSDGKRHGTFRDCAELLPELAGMGFDVLYVPPLHPIGFTNRKGKNNAQTADADDPGSPWAIGAITGGHAELHPELGTMADFESLVAKAAEHGIEIALDLAFQCSPDHPYVKEHPEWFFWRPDGTVQFAENPPKKYQDIIPFYFETSAWQELWHELKRVVVFWIEKGIRIFRVDNPHTKPFPFWDWLMAEIRRDWPDVIFLAEAFTRPKVMYRLAKIGFSQSYTYFTWRTTRDELTAYMGELTRSEVREFFRPNFWPNTPDILPMHLQYGGRPAFIIRLVLAATLSSSYGIYGPVFELGVAEALPGKEEYLDAEKYEIRSWDRDAPGNLKELITTINRIRRENRAFHSTYNVTFYETDNDNLIFYGKVACDGGNIILVVVNLDPSRVQGGRLHVPLEQLGVAQGHPYLVHDLISDEKSIWQGAWNFIELDPRRMPARIFQVRPRLRQEADFDYYM
jgi:starch synthase (maltosyl-transferring)